MRRKGKANIERRFNLQSWEFLKSTVFWVEQMCRPSNSIKAPEVLFEGYFFFVGDESAEELRTERSCDTIVILEELNKVSIRIESRGLGRWSSGWGTDCKSMRSWVWILRTHRVPQCVPFTLAFLQEKGGRREKPASLWAVRLQKRLWWIILSHGGKESWATPVSPCPFQRRSK